MAFQKCSRSLFSKINVLNQTPTNRTILSKVPSDKYDYKLQKKIDESNKESTKKWKFLTLAIALPAVAGAYVIANRNEAEDIAREHLEGRPKFIPYSHLRIRSRSEPMPWRDGNQTLFHNPKRNALPNGYEDEIQD